MSYMVSAIAKHRDLGDKVPVFHTYFTTDDSDPEKAHANFSRDNPGHRDVKVYESERPLNRKELEAKTPDWSAAPAPASV